MICQQCMQRPANVQITQTVNNQKTVIYLCDICAGARESIMIDLPFNMSNLLSSIMGGAPGIAQVPKQDRIEQCDACGMTYEEFTKYGKFGCQNCYSAFGPGMASVFRRLHGSTRHTGKVPSRLNSEKKVVKEIQNLRLLLEAAVKTEEYEKAAQIRDKIRALETEQSRMGGA